MTAVQRRKQHLENNNKLLWDRAQEVAEEERKAAERRKQHMENNKRLLWDRAHQVMQQAEGEGSWEDKLRREHILKNKDLF